MRQATEYLIARFSKAFAEKDAFEVKGSMRDLGEMLGKTQMRTLRSLRGIEMQIELFRDLIDFRVTMSRNIQSEGTIVSVSDVCELIQSFETTFLEVIDDLVGEMEKMEELLLLLKNQQVGRDQLWLQLDVGQATIDKWIALFCKAGLVSELCQVTEHGLAIAKMLEEKVLLSPLLSLSIFPSLEETRWR